MRNPYDPKVKAELGEEELAELKLAFSGVQRERRQARIARGRADPSLIPHGTNSGYTHWCCRCDHCREVGRAVWNAGYAEVWHKRRRERYRKSRQVQR